MEVEVNLFESVEEEAIEEKIEKRNYLFGEFLNSINETKRDVYDEDEKDVRFIANMMLGNSVETVLYANEMNLVRHIPARAHYLFLLNMVPKGRRYAKGIKADAKKVKRISVIKEYFACNDKRAVEIDDIITDEEVKTIKKLMTIGGKR